VGEKGRDAVTDKVLLEVTGPVAVITNNNPEKRNAFDDEMDARLFEILTELKARPDVRAVIWRGEGKAWSSGRDVSVIGTNATPLSHHELMTRGHNGILQVFDLEAPIIVALHGWAIGGSFQRALLCDLRIAAEGSRFMLPELGHGVIPDTGGMGRLFEMCGSGVVSDLVLTGRAMSAEEAYGHGIVSRLVPPETLDETAWEMAQKIAASPMVTVKMARRVLRHLSEPAVRSSMADELIYQTFINKSSDFAEFWAAKTEGREPRYTGS
jgi:enoyl-CoA hydratase/carnithine racemase